MSWREAEEQRNRNIQIRNFELEIIWLEGRISDLKTELKRKPSKIKQINTYLNQIKYKRHQIKQMRYEQLWK